MCTRAIASKLKTFSNSCSATFLSSLPYPPTPPARPRSSPPSLILLHLLLGHAPLLSPSSSYTSCSATLLSSYTSCSATFLSSLPHPPTPPARSRSSPPSLILLHLLRCHVPLLPPSSSYTSCSTTFLSSLPPSPTPSAWSRSSPPSLFLLHLLLGHGLSSLPLPPTPPARPRSSPPSLHRPCPPPALHSSC